MDGQSRDVPGHLPTLGPSSSQMREVGAFENADTAHRPGRKVRRLPVTISLPLMRCLLSLPQVISCPSKCIIWPESDAILIELGENTDPDGKKIWIIIKKASLLKLKGVSERLYSSRVLSNAGLVQVRSPAEPEGITPVFTDARIMHSLTGPCRMPCLLEKA